MKVISLTPAWTINFKLICKKYFWKKIKKKHLRISWSVTLYGRAKWEDHEIPGCTYNAQKRGIRKSYCRSTFEAHYIIDGRKKNIAYDVQVQLLGCNQAKTFITNQEVLIHLSQVNF